jgi:hypothetical protein
MAPIKKLFFFLFIIISNKVYTQERNIYICENKNILIYNEITLYKGDTTQQFRISKITKNHGCIYSEFTCSVMFKNDSLIGSVFTRHNTYGYKITDSLNFNCKNYKSISVNEINIILGDFITKVLDLSEYNIKFNHKKAKPYLDILQQISLIIEDKRLDFLDDYCVHNNLDLNTLESMYWKAKHTNDQNKIFLLAQAYRINKFESYSLIDFNTIWINLHNSYSHSKTNSYFSKRQKKIIKKIIKNKDSIYQLNENCWYGKL